METAWIIGAGHFGKLAAKRLKNKFHFVIVDRDEKHLNDLDSPGHILIRTTQTNYVLPRLIAHIIP